jgi:hypothetical protein
LLREKQAIKQQEAAETGGLHQPDCSGIEQIGTG